MVEAPKNQKEWVARGAHSAHSSAAQSLARPSAVTVLFDVDRKSTRLNSSHLVISYAVFCLKKKKTRHDSNTFGAYCTCCGRAASHALAVCKNGQATRGS